MAGRHPSRKAGQLTVRAPAKLNLTLEVLAKRPDGFHEIRSVAQTIDLCDTLCFRPSQNIEITCDETGWLAEQSLITKVISRLQELSKRPQGVTIEVSKRIPLLSGLGGDSSDAAAVLRGLNQLWELGLSWQGLLDLASSLGADVTFFLYGGTALLKGKGELVTPVPALPRTWLVLMVPPVPRRPGKTGQLYASLQPQHYTKGGITERLVTRLTEGGEAAPSRLFNVFEAVAFEQFPELKRYWDSLLEAGAREVHLSGSGPSLFTLTEDKAQAEEINRRLKLQGLDSCLVATLAATEQM